MPSPAAPADTGRTADYTVNGFDAQQLWDLCQGAVREQYTSTEASYPGSTTFQPLTPGSVRDASQDGIGHVAVFAPSAAFTHGKPVETWVCEFTGDPSAPHLWYASFADR